MSCNPCVQVHRKVYSLLVRLQDVPLPSELEAELRRVKALVLVSGEAIGERRECGLACGAVFRDHVKREG